MIFDITTSLSQIESPIMNVTDFGSFDPCCGREIEEVQWLELQKVEK